MSNIGTVLIVDDSRLVTSVLKETLKPHCTHVLIANSVSEAKQLLTSVAGIDLLLTDIYMKDGEGFVLFDTVKTLKPPPAVIICTSRADEENRRRAAVAGAVALLAKPLSARDVLVEWGKRGRPEIIDRAPRTRIFAQVFAAAEHESQDHLLSYEIHDLSRTGAFLVTTGPLPIGTRLAISIVARDIAAAVVASVVRVQEPSWTHVGGVGVQFDAVDDAVSRKLDDMIRRHGFVSY